jgi:succinyl-CoA synthetase alpha subunit
MSFYINRKTKILIQGISGEKGSFHTDQMLKTGAQIVAGVSPGNGGDWVLDGKIPVLDTVDAAVDATGAEASLVFVPVKNAFDAINEAVWAEIQVIFCLTSGIPPQDIIRIKEILKNRSSNLIGPGSPGMITPDNLSLGFVPPGISSKGNVGVVSRSGPIAYEIIFEMMQAKIGISSYIGIGNEPVVGTDFVEILESFELDPATEKILLIGESDTALEEKTANFIANHTTKPIIGYIAGKKKKTESTLAKLKGKDFEFESGSADIKIEALKSAGVKIAALPNAIPALLLSV